MSNYTSLPLVVDLDGTLIKTDLLLETASQFVLAQPWQTYKLLAWLSQGKSALKIHLAQNISIDATALPYNEVLITWLKQEKAQGRVIVLATASRKLTQMVNKLKIETSISLRMRDEEVEIHGKSNCWDIGRR